MQHGETFIYPKKSGDARREETVAQGRNRGAPKMMIKET